MPLIQRDAPYPHWEFSDPSSGHLLRLVPERGGLISGWRCGDREVVYLDLDRFLDPAQAVRGGFPVLFPITGGLPNNQLPLPQGTFTTGPVRLVDEAAGATLELQLSHPFDLVVLWIEPPRPMGCIEPWSGPRQALLSGDRRIELAPGACTVLNTRYALTRH
jgi:galactose mutarotase-like enzyme